MKIVLSIARASWLILAIMSGITLYEYDSLFNAFMFILFSVLFVVMEEFRQ